MVGTTTEKQDDTIMRSGGGAKSSVNDLLKNHCAFLAAMKHPLESGRTSTSGLPFRQVSELVCDRILISFSKPQPGSYELGLVVTELPSTSDAVGINP